MESHCTRCPEATLLEEQVDNELEESRQTKTIKCFTSQEWAHSPLQGRDRKLSFPDKQIVASECCWHLSQIHLLLTCTLQQSSNEFTNIKYNFADSSSSPTTATTTTNNNNNSNKNVDKGNNYNVSECIFASPMLSRTIVRDRSYVCFEDWAYRGAVTQYRYNSPAACSEKYDTHHTNYIEADEYCYIDNNKFDASMERTLCNRSNHHAHVPKHQLSFSSYSQHVFIEAAVYFILQTMQFSSTVEEATKYIEAFMRSVKLYGTLSALDIKDTAKCVCKCLNKLLNAKITEGIEITNVLTQWSRKNNNVSNTNDNVLGSNEDANVYKDKKNDFDYNSQHCINDVEEYKAQTFNTVMNLFVLEEGKRK